MTGFSFKTRVEWTQAFVLNICSKQLPVGQLIPILVSLDFLLGERNGKYKLSLTVYLFDINIIYNSGWDVKRN